MSVIYFTDENLGTLYSNLVQILERLESPRENPMLPKLHALLVRLGICNRLAYQYTYLREGQEEITLEIPKIDTSSETMFSLKYLIEQLGLLEYNCITNSGRCFCGEKDMKMLKELIDILRSEYIRRLERNQKS